MADVVRFSLHHGIDARGVAAELAHALGGILAEPIRGDCDQATMSYLRLPEHPPERVTLERFATTGTRPTAYRDIDARAVWLLKSSRYRQITEFAERLAGIGAADIRWFSEDEWQRGSSGHAF